MLTVFPDYYPHFRCIAGACRHNCCIGWEIDIDPKTLDFYRTVPGPLGALMQKNIDFGPCPHFILDDEDRCPFLNKDNLCDIISTLGEEHLCTICTQHPRFRNQLPDRLEIGLGLCCEEAARLVLSWPDPVQLVYNGGSPNTEDPILNLRDKILSFLQDRILPLSDRARIVLILCGAKLPGWDISQWASVLMDLERLDDAWTDILRQVRDISVPSAPFNAHMANRQTEYEQLMVYLIYRYFSTASNLEQAAAAGAFAVFSYLFLHAAGAVLYSVQGHFTLEDQVELVRMFSSELEYSPVNLDLLLDIFYDSSFPFEPEE